MAASKQNKIETDTDNITTISNLLFLFSFTKIISNQNDALIHLLNKLTNNINAFI